MNSPCASARSLPDHDYPAYLAAFDRFAESFSAHLDETGVAAECRGEERVGLAFIDPVHWGCPVEIWPLRSVFAALDRA